MQALPVDSLLPEIIRSLLRSPNLVIEAPPGAGKTTRVPAALLDAGLAGGGEVWVLEPRRLAARMSARRVAEERGERLGETVGYQVRFEEVASPRTRLRFLTEGVLTRRLLRDSRLSGVGVVVLDEFHERHLQADLALAPAQAITEGSANPDLRIVAMSATLNSAHPSPVTSAGVRRSVPKAAASKSRSSISRDQMSGCSPSRFTGGAPARRRNVDGDVLVFLPGAAEIRRAQEACAPLASESDVLVVPLHGDLPPGEQDRAVRPASRRRIILSTNVAETSVTIEGVAAVVDSGLARVAGHSPWSGLPTLTSGASASLGRRAAGRAGRRDRPLPALYTAQDFAARQAHEAPESAPRFGRGALELHSAG